MVAGLEGQTAPGGKNPGRKKEPESRRTRRIWVGVSLTPKQGGTGRRTLMGIIGGNAASSESRGLLNEGWREKYSRVYRRTRKKAEESSEVEGGGSSAWQLEKLLPLTIHNGEDRAREGARRRMWRIKGKSIQSSPQKRYKRKREEPGGKGGETAKSRKRRARAKQLVTEGPSRTDRETETTSPGEIEK